MQADASFLRPGDGIVVTGAAQGIGRAVALRLAAEGARLALWDVKAGGLAETAELCRKAGAEVLTAAVDMGEASIVEVAARAVGQAWGAPFAFVSNAGIFPRSAILEADPVLWERVLKVNLVGAFLCARYLGPMMVEKKRGAAVMVASGRALQGTPRGAHYAASKAGLVSLTKSLALELAPHGIRVNCVIPGVTETAQPLEDSTLEEVRARGKRIPLGRIGQPEDIAAGVAMLLGKDAVYMTGQSIALNGGAIMLP
ncbi:MAG TPA: SDR family NAD(P)-dependent oxidoreductase [Alphaproteobacteria bacterium]|nr:SDR family NAD(P)-dependent oxidoreductase [Alphaproteobacteria bacterium]